MKPLQRQKNSIAARIVSVSLFAAVVAATAGTVPAGAWGAKTQADIVTTAVHVLSADRTMRLSALRDVVRNGAMMTQEERAELYPNFDINPVGAIEREMYLLQAVRGDSIDPYFAFRLGGLGALVAQVTAPMANANPVYRDQYYADVDAAIARAEMRTSPRRIVDARAYFSQVQAEAQNQSATIEVDYRTGIGFSGYAQASLSIAASRSVDAVADVWYTILSTGVSRANVMTTNMRDYVLRALNYYIGRKSVSGVEDIYERAESLNLLTPDTRKELGDMFFRASMFERALEQYEAVIAVEPGRRDVMERIAEYHERVGNEALEADRLEAARDAFAAAAEADQLHPDAARRLLEVQDLIEVRDARLAETRNAIQEAQAAEAQAEAEALKRNYAQAITHLRQAQILYGQVTNEFEAEALVASLGLKNIDLVMKEYKTDLISNAQSLSGSAYAQEARKLAENVEDIDEPALRGMLDREYRREVQALRQELQDSLSRTP